MARHGRRIGIILATIVAALLTCASVAAACNEPAIGLSRTQAGPGDIVPFSFTGTDDDATYTVSIGGQVLASGSSSGPTVSGSFVMPDLGGKTEDVTVEGFVSDPAESPYGWKSPARIEYLAPAAASPTTGTGSPTTSPSRSSSAPAASNQSSQAPSSAGANRPASTPPAASGGPSHRPRPSGGPSQHPGQGSGRPHLALPVGRSGGAPSAIPGRTHTSAAQRARAASPASTPLISSAQVPAANVSAVLHRGHPGGTTARRIGSLAKTRALGTQAMATVVSASPFSATAVHRASASRNGGGQALLVALALGMLALGCVAGGGAAASRVLRRRRPHPPPKTVASDPPEAEVPPTADSILEGLDLDAELRRLLEQADRDQTPVQG